MAGARPRELLGLPPLQLEPGMPADLVLFEHRTGPAVRGDGDTDRWASSSTESQHWNRQRSANRNRESECAIDLS